MNNIGIGIMCFGDDYYYKHTQEKISNLEKWGFDCYVLTNSPEKLITNKELGYPNIKIIKHNRHLGSYHDKIILVKKILEFNDISILIDADVLISDYSIFEDLSHYDFKNGISYVESLLSHKIGKSHIKDIQMNSNDIDWIGYKTYLQKIYPQYGDLETIYEYFLVFNKDGLKDNFFLNYEKLQVIKESCDVISGRKTVVGSGEGVSIHVSARISDSQIQKDNDLYLLIKNKIENINRK